MWNFVTSTIAQNIADSSSSQAPATSSSSSSSPSSSSNGNRGNADSTSSSGGYQESKSLSSWLVWEFGAVSAYLISTLFSISKNIFQFVNNSSLLRPIATTGLDMGKGLAKEAGLLTSVVLDVMPFGSFLRGIIYGTTQSAPVAANPQQKSSSSSLLTS